MREEDKQLEGPDLDRAERTHQGPEREEEELPVLAGVELRDVGMEHRSVLFEAMRLVLAGENVNLSLLYLPKRETLALEALQAAVHGRDTTGEFVFAEDRAALLEQALAVLQENVTYGDAAQLAELHGTFTELTAQVGELRERLDNLEDAQEELIADEKERVLKAVRDEAARAGGGGGGGGAPAEPVPPGESTLAGPDRPAPARPPSSLVGDAPPESPRPPSTLVGDPPPESPRPPSTLVGDPPPESPRPPSTLGHDEPGEGGEAGATEKQPWWKKPFG